MNLDTHDMIVAEPVHAKKAAWTQILLKTEATVTLAVVYVAAAYIYIYI